MLGNASNQMLEQAEQGIQAKVPQNMQGDLAKVVHAGLTILYSPKLQQQRNARIAATTDPVKDAGEGSARMMSNLFQQSGKKIPLPLLIPAGMILAFEYLDLLAKAGKAQITPELIAAASKSVADNLLPLFGATPDKVAQVMAQAKQGGAQAPQAQPTPSAPTQAPQGIMNRAAGGM